MISLGDQRQRELTERLKSVYLRRTKEEVLNDSLKSKDERVVLCELSEVQKKIYERILSLSDYNFLRHAKSPCDCGVNQDFFRGYKLLRTR